MFFWLNKILQVLKMASQTLQTIRNGWGPEIKRLNDNLEKLEESLVGTDECVLDIYSLEEKLEARMGNLERELTTVKADVVGLKNYLISVAGIENEVKAEMKQEIDRGTAPPPNSPSGTISPPKYNLRSHID